MKSSNLSFYNRRYRQTCFWQYQKTFVSDLLTLSDLGVFANFQKKWKNVFENWNLHNYAYQRNEPKRVWKVWALILLRWSPVAAHTLLQNFSFLFRYSRFAAVAHFVRPAPRRLVRTTGYYWGLLFKDLPWNGKGCFFSIGQRLLGKPDFAKNSFVKL